MTMPQTRHYEMKDSGVEWIGEMPRAWSAKRIKTLALSSRSLFIDGDWINSPDISEAGIRYFTTGNIGQGYFKEQGNGYITTETFNRLNCTMVHAGDLIISRLNEPIGRACIIPEHYKDCIVAVDNVILRPDDGYSKKYLMYCMSSDRYAEYTALLARGTTMHRISRTQLGNIFLPIPPSSEQAFIVSYLDEKCATIDAIVSEAKSSIEEYKSWKASVIFETVTKGLNPNAEMKDSGVEWIGEIPKGWKVKAAKYCVEIHHGSDPVTEGDVPVYGSGADSFKTCGEYKEGPAVLVGRKGATLHIPHYIIGRYWNVDTAFDVKAHPDFSLKFYYYLAICFDYKFYISQTTLPGMTQTNYRNMPIPVPPLSEQASIVSYLDRKCSLIDGVIAEKEELIRELENYKRSLIFEAVTGKRRVC